MLYFHHYLFLYIHPASSTSPWSNIVSIPWNFCILSNYILSNFVSCLISTSLFFYFRPGVPCPKVVKERQNRKCTRKHLIVVIKSFYYTMLIMLYFEKPSRKCFSMSPLYTLMRDAPAAFPHCPVWIYIPWFPWDWETKEEGGESFRNWRNTHKQHSTTTLNF